MGIQMLNVGNVNSAKGEPDNIIPQQFDLQGQEIELHLINSEEGKQNIYDYAQQMQALKMSQVGYKEIQARS